MYYIYRRIHPDIEKVSQDSESNQLKVLMSPLRVAHDVEIDFGREGLQVRGRRWQPETYRKNTKMGRFIFFFFQSFSSQIELIYVYVLSSRSLAKSFYSRFDTR